MPSFLQCLNVSPFLDARGSSTCPACYRPITEAEIQAMDKAVIDAEMRRAGESDADRAWGFWNLGEGKTYFGSGYGNKITNDQSWKPGSTLCVPDQQATQPGAGATPPIAPLQPTQPTQPTQPFAPGFTPPTPAPDCTNVRPFLDYWQTTCPECYRFITEDEIKALDPEVIRNEMIRVGETPDGMYSGWWNIADGKTYLGWKYGNAVSNDPSWKAAHSLCVPDKPVAKLPPKPVAPVVPAPAPAAGPCRQRPVLHYSQGSTTCPPCYNLIPEARMLQILKNNRQPLLNFMSRSGATPAELQSGSWNIAGGKQLTGAAQGFNIVDGRRPAPSSLCINPYFKPVAKPVPKPVAKRVPKPIAKPVPKPVAKVTTRPSRAIVRR
jgi:hypothetical protein